MGGSFDGTLGSDPEHQDRPHRWLGASRALRSLPPTDHRRIAFFMGIDKAKFRKLAGPGDTLEYHVDKLANRHKIWRYRGEAKVGEILVAEAEISLAQLNPTDTPEGLTRPAHGGQAA